MALTNDDLNNIRQVVKEEFVIGFSSVWEDNLEPNMVVKSELSDLEQRLKKDNQDTRDFIAKKVSELDGASVRRDTILNTKTNTVATTLEGKRIFTTADTEGVRRIAPVAVSPTI